MDGFMSIGEAAEYLGVSITTLRRYEKAGKLAPSRRTFGNHRRYSLQQCNALLGKYAQNIEKTICYARVSSHDQKKDLETQAERLALWCEDNGIRTYEVISDLGSGLNY
jgi:excisionase family DNA binding protein